MFDRIDHIIMYEAALRVHAASQAIRAAALIYDFYDF